MLRVVFRQVGEAEKLEVRVEGEGFQDAPWRRIEAPLSPRELEDLRWYVEEFMDLPVGGYAVKAKRVEEQMAAAGRRLLDAVFHDRHTGAALDRTLRHETADRWLEVAAEPGTSAEPLAWPWELLHDESGFLTTRRLRVRRTLPRGSVTPARPAGAEAARGTQGLRVLVIVCRPDDQGLVSPRATVDAMLRAVADQPVRIDVCRLGTLAELGKMLGRAVDTNDPYDIVHINAHGSFHRNRNASLAFEKEPDEDGRIVTDSVTPEKLGEMLHDKGADLVLLEACRSAMTDREASLTAGFAQGLLQKGIRAVIAMGYTVHVDATARLFGALYQRIAEGATVGDALGTARERLRDEPRRRMGFGPAHERGEVELRDWFVPQLYQHGDDRALLAPGTAATPPPKPPSLRRSAPNRPEPGAFPVKPPHDFVGRVAELHRVGRALERSRAVLVHGLAGTGKTTLAAEVASWALRTRRFEDACFVDFRTVVSEGHALSIMGAALAGAQVVDRDAVVATFRKRPVLVVWDNLERLAEASADEVAALGTLLRDLVEDNGGAAVEGRLLMTSRDPRAADWTVPVRIPLGGLWRPDARELLSRVLRNAEPPVRFHDVLEREGRAAGKAEAEEITDAGRKAIDDLLEFLGDHPLSIELVGPVLATETASVICEGVATRLVESSGARGEASERLGKLEASLAWSISRLDEGARDALQWLTIFRGQVFEKILLDVSRLDPERWTAVRDQLVRGGLIAIEWCVLLDKLPSLVLHPTLAWLATGSLEGDPDIHQRFVNAYVDLALAIERGLHNSVEKFRSMLGGYEREEANMMRAMAWASPERAALLRVTATMCLESLGRGAEARRLPVTTLSDNTSWETRIYQALALISTRPDESLQQLKRFANELAGGPPGSTPQSIAVAFLALGQALLISGQANMAIQPLEDAARHFEQMTHGQIITPGHPLWGNLAAALSNIGNAYIALRRFTKAESIVRNSLRISEARQDRRSIVVGRGQLAAVLEGQGRIDEARREYELALIAAEALGDRQLIIIAEQHLGILEHSANRHEIATTHYRRALDLCLLAGNKKGAMYIRDRLGTLEKDKGDTAAAHTWYDAALIDARTLKDERQEAAILHNLGVLAEREALDARKAGDEARAQRGLADAAQFAHRSLTIKHDLHDEAGEALSWFLLGSIRKHQGQLTEARENLLRSCTISERLGTVGIHSDYTLLAEVTDGLGDAAEARKWRAKASHAQATAAFLSIRPTFLTGFAQTAAAARTGDLGETVDENQELARFPGWLGALGRFFIDTASGTSQPLPDGIPDDAAEVIRRVLAGEDPDKALAEHLPMGDAPAFSEHGSRLSPGGDHRKIAVVLSSAAISAALLRDGHNCPALGEQCIGSLPSVLQQYLTAVSAGQDPGPPPELPVPFDHLFADLFVHGRPLRDIALDLMASLLGEPLAALCSAVADARAADTPPPDLQTTLAQLAADDDTTHASLGAYFHDLLVPGSQPAPPTLGEPIDTLLAAIFPMDRQASS